MPDFKEVFEAYGGNYEETMERFMNNQSFYLRILGLLSQDETFTQLGAALDNGDLDAAFNAAHTLKGVAGNLGLRPLYEAVCRMVEPLRRREARSDYGAMYETVRTEFQRTGELHRTLLGET
ncbi:Hpt domain-containing protein [uncultured Oscillibacter sp.]|uniref:Hpt domain-containing protein n=1 Tax=uncultured Oscillibacter sp. TaxID=876091 RepID=UPI0025ED262B|nr:Hpt domain-containing protein [uncultured Oscillibacter sp.]